MFVCVHVSYQQGLQHALSRMGGETTCIEETLLQQHTVTFIFTEVQELQHGRQ